MSKPTVYLETSLVGYLTSRLSGDLVTAAHQRLTRSWWKLQRPNFTLYVSDLVLREVGAGDPEAAREWMGVLAELIELPTPPEAALVARALIEHKLVPPKAAIDALHVAVAAVNGIDYLLTWNCKHIANAAIRDRVATVIRDLGYKSPVLCTPEELVGENNDDR